MHCVFSSKRLRTTVDQILDTFAECLGGLVSIIGQNLKVHVQALDNVEIKRYLSTRYTVKVDIPKKPTISFKDLQSERSRDFVFELKVPRIEAEKAIECPLRQCGQGIHCNVDQYLICDACRWQTDRGRYVFIDWSTLATLGQFGEGYGENAEERQTREVSYQQHI